MIELDDLNYKDWDKPITYRQLKFYMRKRKIITQYNALGTISTLLFIGALIYVASLQLKSTNALEALGLGLIWGIFMLWGIFIMWCFSKASDLDW